MTRLDSAIRRLSAQRDLLNWAASEIGTAGIVLELGLGNGRTYDHLRTRLPGREIYAFDLVLAAHPDCIPPAGYLILGNIFETLPAFTESVGRGVAALVHADIGSGDETQSREIALQMSPLLEPLLRPGGLLLGDQPFELPACEDISAKARVPQGRYFVYRRKG